MTTSPEVQQLSQDEAIASLGHYDYGWADSDVAGASAKRGLSEAVVRDISAKKSEPQWMLDVRLKALRTFESRPKPGAFRLGDLVKKVSGSAWEGRIVGTYSTALTPEGYAVESASHPGSVQIYPAKALTLVIQEAGIQPTEGQHAQHVDVSGENVNATFRISKQTGADALVGLRGCNSRHGGMRAVEPCGYRMRTTDPSCTGCAERDEDRCDKAARRVRIEWNIGGTSGHGKWFDRSNRSALMVQCLEMSIKHGVGSHRIVDEDQSGEAGHEND